jgi:hypothetical protein
MSKFKNAIAVIEHYKGSIGDDEALMLQELKVTGRKAECATKEMVGKATKEAQQKAHAIAFLNRACEYTPKAVPKTPR